jgi:4-coumarate--CoA ligase
MPVHSRWKIPIPNISLQTHLFQSPTAPIPDRIAFYDADRPETHFLTQEAFRLYSLRFAAGLRKAGLETGDRVLLFSGNNLFFPVVFMGILMAGGIFTGANPGFVARELAYQLQNADAKFLICADASLELGIEAAESIGMSRESIFVYDDELLKGKANSRLGVRNWAELIEPEDVGKKFKWVEPENAKDTICALNYSSGTTGVPKGVMITHYAYIANCLQVAHQAKLHPDYEKRRKMA